MKKFAKQTSQTPLLLRMLQTWIFMKQTNFACKSWKRFSGIFCMYIWFMIHNHTPYTTCRQTILAPPSPSSALAMLAFVWYSTYIQLDGSSRVSSHILRWYRFEYTIPVAFRWCSNLTDRKKKKSSQKKSHQTALCAWVGRGARGISYLLQHLNHERIGRAKPCFELEPWAMLASASVASVDIEFDIHLHMLAGSRSSIRQRVCRRNIWDTISTVL